MNTTQSSIPFSLNRIAAPQLSLEDFFALATDLGVEAVEFRNDLDGVEIKDGTPPSKIRDLAMEHGIRVLSINALYPFDVWDEARAQQAEEMARYACQCGADGLVMCPLNDPDDPRSEQERRDGLRQALAGIMPILGEHGVLGYVEPLGFAESALRHKCTAREAIAAVGGQDVFRLVHDTFHHHLAQDSEFFPKETGLVHVSGVTDTTLSREQMLDGHRVLVDGQDVLDNIGQVRTMIARGYRGYVSFEPFAEEVRRLPADAARETLRESMAYLDSGVGAS